MIPDHFLTMVLFSVIVALFFATLYHRDAKSFRWSVIKSLLWMIPGSLAFTFLMYWTGG